MPEPEEELPEVYVQPGESHLVREPTILETLLGSCVGIAFWVPRLGLGALCHPMLPRTPARLAVSLTRSAGCRYVDFAIRDLAGNSTPLGANRGEIEVKLFGGGDVLVMTGQCEVADGGHAEQRGGDEGARGGRLGVTASSLGGKRGVNIHFNTKTGEVLLQRHS